MRSLLIIVSIFLYSNYLAQDKIDGLIAEYKKDKDLSHAMYSFCILDSKSGNMIREFNSEISLVPASTLKIITTSAALGILGKDYSYKTSFYTYTEIDSVTKKNKTHLVVKGSGDPSFNSSYFNSSDSTFLTSIVSKLKDKMGGKLNGNIIIDNSILSDKIPGTWIWSDIGNYFGAGANGLSYKDNKFSIYYNSGSEGSEATITDIKPHYYKNAISLVSNVKSYGTEDEAYVYGAPDSYTKYVSGTIPPNKKNYEVEAQAPNPALFFAYELLEELKKQKLIHEGSIAQINNKQLNPSNQKLIYTYSSPKLDKILYYTNVKSNNHYAESILKTVGAIKTGKQGTTENGIEEVKKFWSARGLDVSGLYMADGSGLSRANSITTKFQASVLSKIYRDTSMYQSFYNSLPIAGKNGSMTNIGKGTFIENNMRAKTGYINRARGYCGYVKTKSGKELAFSVLFNNYNCSPKEMKLKIEKLLVAIAEL